MTPTGVAGQVLAWFGVLVTGGQALSSDKPIETAFDESLKALSAKGGQKFFQEVLGYTPAAAARATALIDEAGGWDAFVNRAKIELSNTELDDDMQK